MSLTSTLEKIWSLSDEPFLVTEEGSLSFKDLSSQVVPAIDNIEPGSVVALIGDFDPVSLATLIQLIDLGAVIAPLTSDTRNQHEYFFDAACVDYVVENNQIYKRKDTKSHPLLDELRERGHAGLILFSSGTTGKPKAILHDMTLFLERFNTPRPTLRTLSFLLFDHIGGLNTLLHTLFNKGVVISPKDRSIDSVLSACQKHQVELLPTTPTFLRMLLLSGEIPDSIPESLKVITYGTERMDQATLDELCNQLPQVDFRQTFGMSELGIVRVKSEARNSLFMKVGGEGVETRVLDQVLEIRAKNRMLGYLNAPSPFTEDGWYNTKDIVEEKAGFYKVTGRISDVVNVGGLKFMASDVENLAVKHPNIAMVKAFAKENPITGQHLEMQVQPKDADSFDKAEFISFLKENLQAHMVPKRVKVTDIAVGHRYKKA